MEADFDFDSGGAWELVILGGLSLCPSARALKARGGFQAPQA